MQETEISNTHIGEPVVDNSKRIQELELWFRNVGLHNILVYLSCDYFKIEQEKSRYDIYKEIYEKEQEFRELKGKNKLPEIKLININ